MKQVAPLHLIAIELVQYLLNYEFYDNSFAFHVFREKKTVYIFFQRAEGNVFCYLIIFHTDFKWNKKKFITCVNKIQIPF